jgi:hypothetical protein
MCRNRLWNFGDPACSFLGLCTIAPENDVEPGAVVLLRQPRGEHRRERTL